jgi:hypothetical protein
MTSLLLGSSSSSRKTGRSQPVDFAATPDREDEKRVPVPNVSGVAKVTTRIHGLNFE